MSALSTIGLNLHDVRRRLEAAAQCVHTGPPPRLIAVSKTFPAAAVREAAAAGQRDFGENRVQEGLDKIAATADLGLTWHLIGHLQSNKAKRAAATFDWIHSVDSLGLLQKLDAGATEAGTRPQILLQVDLAGEVTKFGVPANALTELAAAAVEARGLQLRGLMIIPPAVVNPSDARPWFAGVRDLRDSLISGGVPAEAMTELSMGMSHDFEVAIEEGATMIRVGTAIFGGRPSAPSTLSAPS